MKRIRLFAALLLFPFVLFAQQALDAGTYYIMNKASGTWLSAGATWGTRCVLAEHGIDFRVTMAGGQYTLTTQIQGADKALRPSDGYMDQSGAWTVEPLADGTYALFNGSKYFGYAATNAHPWVPRLDFDTSEGDHTHWRFFTPDELRAQLAEANSENPVDASFLIQAPDFLTGDYRVTGTKVWGGDLTAIGGNMAGDSYLLNNANGEVFNKAAFNITQKLTGIPNGVYSLSVQGYYRYGSNTNAAAAHNNGTEQLLPYLYAGQLREPMPSVYKEAKAASASGWNYNTAAGYVPNDQASAAACFDAGAYVTTLHDIVVVDGTLTIGIAKDSKAVANDWTCFDNFTLLYYGSDLGAIRQAALEEIARYEALNTTADEEFAQSIATQRKNVENATSEEDIAQALTAVREAYGIYFSKPEPTDTPLALNTLLENPQLTQGTQGWEALIENLEGYNQKWYANTSSLVAVLETYAGFDVQEMRAFSLLQPVTLSPGMYRLKGYSFYRYGTSYNSDITNEGEGRSLAYLVAGDFSQRVMRLGDIEQQTYPNSLAEAAEAFGRGEYLNSLIFELDQPTTLYIGYRGEHTRYRSWFVAGPVTLEKINDQILEQESDDEFALLKTQYARRWEGYKAISSQATVHETFDQFIEQAKQSLVDVIDQAGLDQLDNQVWQALCQLLKTGTTATGQFDITSLIENPSLTTSLTSWQVKYPVGWDAVGAGEVFGQPENEVSQTLHQMPSGNYTMKVQAFYRMTTFGTSSLNYESGTDKVCGYMYLGSASQPLRSINDDARHLSARPLSDVAGAYGRSIPNTISGAADAFHAGLYWNVLRTTVDADGDLTLGLRVAGGEAANWMPFDNFRLYYGQPTTDVSLSAMTKHTIDEDSYVNLTTDIELQPDRYNSLCLPFDVNVSQFQSVWTVADVTFDAAEKKLTATLTPLAPLLPRPTASSPLIIPAGTPFLARVGEACTLAANDVLLRACKPDSVPVLWEGAAMQGYFGKTSLQKTYRFDNESPDSPLYSTLRSNCPGYRFMINLNSEINNKAKTIVLREVDYDNVDITLNLENLQARQFLSKVTYSTGSESVIESYNRCPPGRKDQPHTVWLPVPQLRSPQTLTFTPALPYSITIPAGQAYCEVSNLVPGQEYSYLVTDQSGNPTSKGTIHTQGYLRMIKAPSMSNVRDLGGWRTSEGLRLRYGLIYRGGEMNGGHQMNETDRQVLLDLGIGAEVDLREDADIQNYALSGSALGSDVPYIYLNQHMFGDDALEQDTAKYRRIFPFILQHLREGKSVYFHCIWGADRTGALAFLLEGLLGLTPDQLYKDYELTTFSIAGTRVKSGLDTKFTFIRALAGKTLQEKFFTYWRDHVGIPASDLCEFIALMTDGQPAIVTAIEEITRQGSDEAQHWTLESLGQSKNSYDLSGRPVTSPLPKGVYIKNGRKVVVR